MKSSKKPSKNQKGKQKQKKGKKRAELTQIETVFRKLRKSLKVAKSHLVQGSTKIISQNLKIKKRKQKRKRTNQQNNDDLAPEDQDFGYEPTNENSSSRSQKINNKIEKAQERITLLKSINSFHINLCAALLSRFDLKYHFSKEEYSGFESKVTKSI